MTEANNSSVRVEIFDQAYILCGDADYIRELAGHVDRMMRVMDNGKVDSARLGVLAALNIAEEYYQLKSQLGEEEGRENQKSREKSRKPLSEEERQRNRERRQRHYTKRSYEKQLLALVNDESIPAKERRGVLLALGKSRGYYQRPPAKR